MMAFASSCSCGAQGKLQVIIHRDNNGVTLCVNERSESISIDLSNDEVTYLRKELEQNDRRSQESHTR